jgi:hypothetical protein
VLKLPIPIFAHMKRQRNAPDDMAFVLTQSALEYERTDGANLTVELRNARTTLDQVQKELRAKQALLPPQPQAQPPVSQRHVKAISLSNTPVPSFAAQSYESQAPTPVSTSMPMSYGYNLPYHPVAPALASAAPTLAPAPAPAPVAATNAAQVPVQIPVSALSALTQLGIIPVAETSLSPGVPRPQCVLTGIHQNGTMLSLELNVGSLRGNQVNGLALLLGSLMTGRDAAPGPAPAPAPAPAPESNPTTNGTSPSTVSLSGSSAESKGNSSRSTPSG